MRRHLFERGRRAPLAAAATTVALAMPLGLCTTALAGARAFPHHRISLHAVKVSSNAHHVHPSFLADLTSLSAKTEFPAWSISAVAPVKPNEWRTPVASARGPPESARTP